ncbi:MAG: hypothetical protein GY847_22105 [Proteobacteria bacterium]|nr:hypothetical protein [Pseudomonadota bacterium]
MRLGIDIGSVSIAVALIDNNNIIRSNCVNSEGNIADVLLSILRDYPLSNVSKVGVTGTGHEYVGNMFKSIDSVICFLEGTKYFYPSISNIIFIGGESFGLIELNEKGNYKRHNINTSCAAGTGSFIDQQAKRINVSTENLADLASNFSGTAPQIATRCAVFAKSDIIHFQQEGNSRDSICCGLCNGVSRSILDTILSGRRLIGETAIIGGVSKNIQVVRAIEQSLGNKVLITDYSDVVGAIGAALLAGDFNAEDTANNNTISSLNLSYFKKDEIKRKRENIRPPLELKLSSYPDFRYESFYIDEATEVASYKLLKKDDKYEVVMGIDIGSTSTKVTLVDFNKDILLSFYNSTSGDPIDATKRIFKCITNFMRKYGVDLIIKSVGTTGSGRKLVKEIINADFEINEITAHSRAAVFIDPNVDTIIEIGGQDSKFTQLRDGSVYNSVMNYVCAAGTGSFIEEQAKKLDVEIDDYAEMAMGIEAPFTSDRCTVYMERDINVLLSRGWDKRQLLAAVLHSVRDNYMNTVVSGAFIGNSVYFQGATARNKALVAAFEQLLEKPIHVSPHCHLTGALGVSLLLLDQNIDKTSFIGLQFADANISTETEICELCNNKCKLTLINSHDNNIAYGLMCGRDYADKKPTKKKLKHFDAVKKYNELIQIPTQAGPKRRKVIGIPICLFMFEYINLWKSFFNYLGYEVVTSRSSKEIVKQGRAHLAADFCAPIMLAHGHVKELLDKKVDYIFLPSMIREDDPDNKDHLKLFSNKTIDCYYCYFTEFLPNILKSLPAFDMENKLIDPLLYFNEDLPMISQRIYNSLKEHLDVTESEVISTFSLVYEEFLRAKKRLKHFGEVELSKTKSEDGIAVVILGRPYSFLDKTISIDIPNKIVNMGYKVIFQDMLPLENVSREYSERFIDRMHWNYGQKILKAAEYVISNDNLFPLFLTNFRCGPDSFILEYFKETMNRAGKPYLTIQLDAHGSDVGYITRLEAGIEAFKNWRKKRIISKPPPLMIPDRKLEKDMTILIPPVDNIATGFLKDTFNSYGYDSYVLEENEAAMDLGLRQVSGGECLPIISVIGAIIHTVDKYNLDPAKIAVYGPVVCVACNISQYLVLGELVFTKFGWLDLFPFTYNPLMAMPDTPFGMTVTFWRSQIVASLLRKLCAKIKPYEVNKGETDAVNEKAVELVKKAILKKRNLIRPFKKAFAMFRKIETKYTPKPRIAIVGDLYAKYNSVINQNIADMIENMGGELVYTSTSEYIFIGLDLDRHILARHKNKRFQRFLFKSRYNLLKKSEERFERVARPILKDQEEPSPDELSRALSKYGIDGELTGETMLSLARTIIFIERGLVDAIVHVNPIFCCPGIVTTSVFEKIQEDYNIPIINIFYDGTGDHNKVLIPHLHYLKKRKLADSHSEQAGSPPDR